MRKIILISIAIFFNFNIFAQNLENLDKDLLNKSSYSGGTEVSFLAGTAFVAAVSTLPFENQRYSRDHGFFGVGGKLRLNDKAGTICIDIMIAPLAFDRYIFEVSSRGSGVYLNAWGTTLHPQFQHQGIEV